jgi:hypothetical protein
MRQDVEASKRNNAQLYVDTGLIELLYMGQGKVSKHSKQEVVDVIIG